MKRWLLLEDHTALSKASWLPPAETWPELAPFRAEHERLLAVALEEKIAWQEIRKQHEAEDAARSETLKAAFLTGQDATDGAGAPEEREAELANAVMRAEAATDALHTFLQEVIAEIQRRAPEWYALLDSRTAEAEEKRKEAQRLLAEADEQVRQTQSMRQWLDRESGRSALGHIAFTELAPGLAQGAGRLVHTERGVVRMEEVVSA